MSVRSEVDQLRKEVGEKVVSDKRIKYRILLAILDTLVDIKYELERRSK